MADRFAKYRRLRDSELRRIADATQDDDLIAFIGEELTERAWARESYQEAYDEANPPLPEPWWVNP